ncbi:hypothetical protein JTE90_013445 [Oedothorax gibbosus]|uniref:RNA helicase n=1 Tax=Oedothorax gibbosus TaxID=931172 RepID=A0AAV6VKY8_9ARAC|nr:hypothetical protein JTE90_013445 [Oedothorax gibbosus]
MAENDAELLNYEDENEQEQSVPETFSAGGYASQQDLRFKDLLLRPSLLRAIAECGFEHPSEVQHECIPPATISLDILCQTQSGMGKTTAFMLSTLQYLDPVDNQVSVLVMCHTRELAFQIAKVYERFSKHMSTIKVCVFVGGWPIANDEMALQSNCPNIVVGTPGRILALVKTNKLNLRHIKHFILDECDKMLEALDMRSDVQEIFKTTPRDKQVMMFSATLSKEIRPVCLKFMDLPIEIYVDDEAKLTLSGLRQFYVKLRDSEKNRKLFDILDELGIQPALSLLLEQQNFPAIAIHSDLTQEERFSRYYQFKDCHKRILVTTNIFSRGMDMGRVNLVVNYDVPEDSDTYLHRVARAGRFGTKGKAITFVSDDVDAKILDEVQERFDVWIKELCARCLFVRGHVGGCKSIS